MNQDECLKYLIQYLIIEQHLNLDITNYSDDLFSLYRSLVNIRPAAPVSEEFIKIQNQMLKDMSHHRGIVDILSKQHIIIWKGDITRLRVDAIVNAANHQMEGCFIPGHQCIDNAIHTYAGVQLRNECHRIMQNQGYLEPSGKAKITPAYNLPSHYILHTVGPVISDHVTDKDELLLASCYESCLRLAEEYQLKSIAFCCISTGVFHFPPKKAAYIAIETVTNYLKHSSIEKVIFNVFKDEDEKIYHQLYDHRK